MYKASGNDINL